MLSSFVVASALGCSESSEQNTSETESKRAPGGRWGLWGFVFCFCSCFVKIREEK